MGVEFRYGLWGRLRRSPGRQAPLREDRVQDPGEGLSARLRELLQSAGAGSAGNRPLTLGDLMDRSEEHGFGLLFVALSLPPFVPVLPWGTAAAIGAAFMGLGLQRGLGRRRPWLPRRVRAMVIGEKAASFLQNRALPVLERLERISSRRLPVATSEPVHRAAGFAVALSGLLMLLPLPFLNSLPALLVLVTGLGFLKGDGLFLIAGSAGGFALFAVVVALLAAGMLFAGVGL